MKIRCEAAAVADGGHTHLPRGSLVLEVGGYRPRRPREHAAHALAEAGERVEGGRQRAAAGASPGCRRRKEASARSAVVQCARWFGVGKHKCVGERGREENGFVSQ